MPRDAAVTFDADVIVVGGGLAGVRAARDVAERGASVVLLEARDRLGGRVWTRPFRGRAETIELGGTWVAADVHPHVAQEIGRYGLRLVSSHGGALDTRWRLGGELVSGFPLDNEEIIALERVLFGLIDASHRVAVDTPRDHGGLADLDVDVAAFVRGFDVPARVRDYLYSWAALGSGAAAAEWSALTALSWIAAMRHSVYGWYGAVTDHFEIGAGGLVELLARDSGAQIELAAPVARISQTPDGVLVETAAGRRLHARACVVATPLATWPQIEFDPPLAADKAAAAAAGHPGRMKKVWMIVSGVPANLFACGFGTDFVQLFCEQEVAEGFLAIGMCAPPSELDPADLDAVTAAVRQWEPGARVLATDTHDWAADPWSKGTWMVLAAGHARALARRVEPPEGRVAFAGADVAVRWIGWLDGALESGARAAAEALAAIGGATLTGWSGDLGCPR